MRLAIARPEDAIGSVLAHAVTARGRRMPKGTPIGPHEVRTLADAGLAEVEVAVPDENDVTEDEAATRCAMAMLGHAGGTALDRASTGRVNLRATRDGVFVASGSVIDALNGIDPRLTVATLADTTRVTAGTLVATVKIIPFFVPDAAVATWERTAREAGSIAVAAFTVERVAHVSTTLPTLKPGTMDKTRRVLSERLAGTGVALLDEVRCPHEREALAPAIDAASRTADLVIVFAASAVTDVADVVPDAIRAAGGRVHRVGMPVDPGNLLVWGDVNGVAVLGAPGCARSPARNGFDWALDRALAGRGDIAAVARLGVGGLLKEIGSRPRPREAQ